MVKKYVLVDNEGSKYLVEKGKREFSTTFGQVNLRDLKEGKPIKTHIGHEFQVYEARFVDLFQRARRGPQVILPKDAGAILANTGIGPGCKVLDAGAGSGWMTLVLANAVGPKGKVFSYERNSDFAKLAKSNFEYFEMKNITLKDADIYNGISEKNLDLINLDLPEPWQVIEHAENALKVGGFLSVYLPNTTQIQQFCDKLSKNKNFKIVKVCEEIERDWKVEDKVLRPEHHMLGHTAFLIFARRIA